MGFVVCRSSTYSNQDKWAAFRRRWDEIVAPQIHEYIASPVSDKLNRTFSSAGWRIRQWRMLRYRKSPAGFSQRIKSVMRQKEKAVVARDADLRTKTPEASFVHSLRSSRFKTLRLPRCDTLFPIIHSRLPASLPRLSPSTGTDSVRRSRGQAIPREGLLWCRR